MSARPGGRVAPTRPPQFCIQPIVAVLAERLLLAGRRRQPHFQKVGPAAVSRPSFQKAGPKAVPQPSFQKAGPKAVPQPSLQKVGLSEPVPWPNLQKVGPTEIAAQLNPQGPAMANSHTAPADITDPTSRE